MCTLTKERAPKWRTIFRESLNRTGLPMELPDGCQHSLLSGLQHLRMRHRIPPWGMRSQENVDCSADPSWVCHRKWLQGIWGNLPLGSIITKNPAGKQHRGVNPSLWWLRFCRCFPKGKALLWRVQLTVLPAQRAPDTDKTGQVRNRNKWLRDKGEKCW